MRPLKSLLVTAAIALPLSIGAWVAHHRSRATSPSSPVAPSAGTGAATASPASGVGAALFGQPAAPDFVEMGRQVEATVARNPDDLSVRMQAATFYTRTENHIAAVKHLQAATRLSPKQAIPWIALGDSATLARQLELADQAYAKAGALEPDNPFLLRGRAQLLIARRRYPDARAVLEGAVRKHPEAPELRLALGSVYLILDQPERAKKAVEPALRDAPGSPDLHMLMADIHEREGELEKAISELQTVVRQDPASERAWAKIGLYRIRLGRYEEARSVLERAISLNPREALYQVALGDSFALDTAAPASFERAVECYRRALAQDPKCDQALYSFAMACTRRGRPEDLREAAGMFQRLLDRHSSEMNVHFKLAETYRRLGEPGKAREHMARFQELSQASRRKNKARYQSGSFEDTAEAHVKLARRHMAEKAYELARTEFQLALQRNPALQEAKLGLESVERLITSTGQDPFRSRAGR